MKKNVRYWISTFMAVVMLGCLSGCSMDNNWDTSRTMTGFEDKQAAVKDSFSTEKEISSSEENSEPETAMSDEKGSEPETAAYGEDLDVAVSNTTDDNWYMKENIFTDDKGNRLEVFFDDYGMIEFAINGLSLYYTTVEKYQQENNWRVYTCDDGMIVIYYPGEPSHIEISDGDYSGIYECSMIK